MDKIVVMKLQDNVATCLADMHTGEEAIVKIHGSVSSITLRNDIPFGHKIALADIAEGNKILKYAEVIGIASQRIKTGEHVHVHNVDSLRARGDQS